MNTVRFTQVVAASGKPEEYFLFDPKDPPFLKALKEHRVLTLQREGSGPGHAFVGYDTGRRGQLFIFPRSLQPFIDSRIVGIKYDVLSPPEEKSEPEPTPSPRKTASRPPAHESETLKRTLKEASAKKYPELPLQGEKAPKRHVQKVLAFEPEEKEVEPGIPELKAIARRALAALGSRQPARARELLKEIIDYPQD